MGTWMLAWLLAAGPVPEDVCPINQHNFRIPISIDPARRHEMKELLLFSSSDQGKSWQQVAVATPDQDGFPFYANADGLYWFAVCVVDPQGKRDPADIYKVPPEQIQKILVDTLKPVLSIVSAERQGEEIVVSWAMQEDHPDLTTLKLEYRTPDAPANQWYMAPLTPAPSGQTRFRLANPAAVSIRMQVQDLAKNMGAASREVPAAANNGFTTVAAATAPAPVTTPAPAPVAPPLPPPTQPAAANTTWDIPHSPAPIADSHNDTRMPAEQPHNAAPLPNYAPAPAAPVDTGTRLVASSESVPALTSPALDTGANHVHGSLPNMQIINTKQVSFEYEVKNVGPSGIGKVELWITRDDGHTWERYFENANPNPSARTLTVDLPGEGVYGFCLVAQSRANRGKRPPVPGDPPEIRLEVDMTKPAAQLFLCGMDPQLPNGLLLSWTVTDKNLAAKPITLEWAEQREGPWQRIAAELPNTGRYTWDLGAIKDMIPYRVYLRLSAHDMAGNITVVETKEPECIDLKEPEGRLLGIVTATVHK